MKFVHFFIRFRLVFYKNKINYWIYYQISSFIHHNFVSYPLRNSAVPKTRLNNGNVLFFFNFIAVPRVTTDGSPHEILTLVACISGLIVAIIVFAIILLTLREQEQMETHPMACKRSLGDDVEAQSCPKDQQKVTVFTIFGSSKRSFDVTC